MKHNYIFSVILKAYVDCILVLSVLGGKNQSSNILLTEISLNLYYSLFYVLSEYILASHLKTFISSEIVICI